MRFRHRAVSALVACALVTGAAQAERPDVLLTSPLAEVWGKPPTIDRPRISPDGSKLLFVTQDPEGIGVALVLHLETGELNPVGVGTEEAYDLGWCEWASNERVVCDLVYAVDADGSNLTQIQRGRITRPPERIGTCGIPRGVAATEITMDWTPEDPEHIVQTCGTAESYNLYSGLKEQIGVGSGRDLRGTLMSDGHNFTRIQRHRDQQAGFDRWYFREEIGGDWTLFHETNPLEFSEPLRPLGFGENLSILFHLAPINGLWAVQAYDLSAEPTNHQIYGHPLFDIELVDTMGAYDRVVAAAYLDERPQRVLLDERIREVYVAALEAFPDANVEVVDESWDQNKYVLLVRPPRRAGNYFLLDFADGTLEPLGAMYDHLTDVELADTQSIEFIAPDDGLVSGHVTLPPGVAGTIPTVIIPRSLPSRFDIADPHYLVQFLVANGYAVLRLNNRGPEEYNGAWIANRTAFAWKRAADDVDAAMDYLIEQGVAEEGRICVLGRDVGAYAGFMHAIEYPGRMNCIVGIGATAQPAGGDWQTVIAGEYAILERNSSPIRRSKDFDAPVLLFHGQYDGLVDMLSNSANLHRALDRGDFDATFIEYEHARHNIERVHYRTDMLTRIAQFLDAHIGR